MVASGVYIAKEISQRSYLVPLKAFILILFSTHFSLVSLLEMSAGNSVFVIRVRVSWNLMQCALSMSSSEKSTENMFKLNTCPSTSNAFNGMFGNFLKNQIVHFQFLVPMNYRIYWKCCSICF